MRSGTERGELVRWATNVATFGPVLALLGMNPAKMMIDSMAGGGTRFLDGAKDLTIGLLSDDETKMRRGASSILLPPAIPPVMDIARDSVTWVSSFGPGGKPMFSKAGVHRVLYADYWPTKRISRETIPALQAIWFNEPRPVLNTITKSPDYWIDPKDATETILFGFRGQPATEHARLLSDIAKARLAADKQSKAREFRANEIIAQMNNKDVVARKKFFAELNMAGELQDENMIKAIRDNILSAQIFQSGVVEAQLKSLPNEQRAGVLIDWLTGMSQENRAAQLSSYQAQGILTEETVLEILKQSK